MIYTIHLNILKNSKAVREVMKQCYEYLLHEHQARTNTGFSIRAIHFGLVILSTDADPTGSDVAGFGEDTVIGSRIDMSDCRYWHLLILRD
jgi:hypothetical protein